MSPSLPGPNQGPPPDAGQAPPQQGGPGASGGGAVQIMELVRQVMSAAQVLGQRVPGAVPITSQILQLTQELQKKILQVQPPAEAQAPPV
jgi:hypothetical protein